MYYFLEREIDFNQCWFGDHLSQCWLGEHLSWLSSLNHNQVKNLIGGYISIFCFIQNNVRSFLLFSPPTSRKRKKKGRTKGGRFEFVKFGTVFLHKLFSKVRNLSKGGVVFNLYNLLCIMIDIVPSIKSKYFLFRIKLDGKKIF